MKRTTKPWREISRVPLPPWPQAWEQQRHNPDTSIFPHLSSDKHSSDKHRGRDLQAAFHVLGAPPGVSQRGNTQPFPRHCCRKHSFSGKFGKAGGQETAPGKMFGTYKMRRVILLLHARNNKDKLLSSCKMPSASLKQCPSSQKDQAGCRRAGNVLSLK